MRLSILPFALGACVSDPEFVPVGDADDQPPAAHVVTALTVADELGAALDPLMAERLATNTHVVVLQTLDADAWTDDASIAVGLVSAVDTDHRGLDNASGTEVMDAHGFVDADGRATITAPAALSGGHYTADVAASTLRVGAITFAVATPIHVDADMASDGTSQTGAITAGVTLEALTATLQQEGVDDGVIAQVTSLADLDLDGDGTAEALSLEFRFEAHACGLIDRPVLADEGNRDGTCTFNADCPADQRCTCADYLCACADGARGDGATGVDTCEVGDDCFSSLCVEGADAYYCSGECETGDDCGPALPVCADIAMLGRVCIRE